MPFVHSLKVPAGGFDAGETHTVIFVDVDGVLNIGARDDSGGAPLLFSDTNVEHAKRLVQGGGANAEHECVQKLVSINERRLVGEEGTLGSLASRAPANVSPTLANRLAELIRAAGPSRTVVLSSSWRRPQHKLRAARLEQEISQHLGSTFTFDERTPLRDDSSAQERLECIGDFLGSLKVLPQGGKLRLLILEDFFITPLKTWQCNGIKVDSTEVAERYLLSRLPDSVTATARVVHTYDEWVTPKGLFVQAGVGLTLEHFTKAMDFLSDADVDADSLENANMNDIESNDLLMKEGNYSPDDIIITNKTSAKEAYILLDVQAQKRWLECLSPARL